MPSPGMPEMVDNKGERNRRSDRSYGEVRVGSAINKRDFDNIAGSKRQVDKGKESANVQ